MIYVARSMSELLISFRERKKNDRNPNRTFVHLAVQKKINFIHFHFKNKFINENASQLWHNSSITNHSCKYRIYLS